MMDAARGITEDSRQRNAPQLGAVYLLFFLSGSAALVCEMSWSRQVGLVVGNTAGAAALVLAAFFAGMAVGQLLGGWLVPRVRALLGYGIVELVVAGWVCLVPELLVAVGSAEVGDATASALCVIVLLPATIPLGATLPFVAELVATRADGRRVSLVYGLNTAGGLLGIVAATAFLLVSVGVVASSYIAAGVSAVCGLVACGLALRKHSDASPPRDTTSPDVPLTWWLISAVSGFGILGLEVLYTRLFALVLHNSTYTFGAVVAVFLAGLASGAAFVAAIGRRVPTPLLLAAASALGAVAVEASLVAFIRLTGFDYFAAGDTFGGYLSGVFSLVAAVVLPPAVLLGMTLPGLLACSGRSVGKLAAVNTAAAVVGALATGFLFLPWLGLWGTFTLHVLLFGLTGVMILFRGGWRRSATGVAVVVAVAAVVAGTAPERGFRQGHKDEEIVRRWETAYGWIDVTRADHSLRVRQNLHYRHGSTASAVREHRQGRLPLLMHPKPTDVAFLGLGTGLTAAPVVADSEVERAVIVELIPEVVEAARMLSTANCGIVDHPKVEVRVDDARHYLSRTDRQFDLIVADLFVPWESRAGYLYTVEFYETARRRLKPGGRFCQWLALYQFGSAEFELVADSFAAVFPEVTLWWGQIDGRSPILALVGSDETLDLDPGRLETRWSTLGELPGGADPELARPRDLLGLFVGEWPPHPSAVLNTDEHPRLEFAAPVSHSSGRRLSGPPLQAYFDEVLARLPQGGTRFQVPGADNPGHRLAAQRLGLFGTVGP